MNMHNIHAKCQSDHVATLDITRACMIFNLMYALSTDVLLVYFVQETESWKRELARRGRQAIRCRGIQRSTGVH